MAINSVYLITLLLFVSINTICAASVPKEHLIIGSSMKKVIHFVVDRYDLDKYSKSIIAELANELLLHPSINVVLKGYTDCHGDSALNLIAGELRARSVSKLLVNHGVNINRIEIISYGEDNPICKNYTAKCLRINNRVEVFLK
jgi:peptidoglycan-associated lipoprotein